MNNQLAKILNVIGLKGGYYYNYTRYPMRLTYDVPKKVTGLPDVECTWGHADE